MPEPFLFHAAGSLLGKLASYAYEEASRAYGVYDDLQGFKGTLSIVKGVLLDAEKKKDQNHGLRAWLGQIQNICSDAEDVLDEFEFQSKRKQVVKASGSNRMKVGHFLSSSNPVIFRLRMAHHIKDIRDRLDKVAADGTRFGLERIHVDNDHKLGVHMQKREMTYSHVNASNVIGREEDREEIIQILMQTQAQTHLDGVCVIPIVGIGGLGKTTLAKLVFNDERIDGLFQLKLWVCVSDNFDIRQTIVKILSSASASAFSSAPTIALSHQENLNSLDIEQLQSRLRHKLSGQKFLLVLDDIWNDDRAKWIELADLIKAGAVESKIIVTTRINSIASMMGTVPTYVLEGLSLEDCMSLFVKWAFKEGEEGKYPKLLEIGKEIVKKCRGVPLAVRTLGNFLFSDLDLDNWKFVRDHQIWNLEQKKDDILPALKLSYDEMPSYLRQCFATFSLYPKDFTFWSDEIIGLWVALGLVQSCDGSQKLENTARKYIDELHSRSFLEDLEDFGHLYLFKVHDLVHDLALYVAKEEFLVVDSHTQNIPEQVRHLSVVEDDLLGYALFPKSRSIRTILFPIEGVGLKSESLLDRWFSTYRHLWVLNLSDSTFDTLPNSIGKLEHLRFLDLSDNCEIKILPNYVCKLHHLQVLSLRGCMKLEKLPQGLGKLISLRQLYITTKQSVLPENEFASLNNLQILSFEYCYNLKLLFKGVQVKLPLLEALFVQSCSSLETLPLCILPQLVVLSVLDCKRLDLHLDHHDISIQRLKMNSLMLGSLPGLVMLPLWINRAADTLQTLMIIDLPLSELPPFLVTPNLKRFHIAECHVVRRLPFDMDFVTALEDLRIYDCTKLCQSYQPQSGKYWHMIAHVKNVAIEVGNQETERSSKFVFFDRESVQFELEDLLRASGEVLGKGNLGTVYRAVLDDGNTVAVKMLKNANPCERGEFEQYMDLVGELKHPNIVTLRAYYYAKEQKILVYDYLPNESLRALLHGNRGPGRIPLDWTTRISLVLGAARGLAHIHAEYSAAKLPHGNIKSSNVLLDKNGIASIADFGLSFLLNPVHAITRLGGYRAPEQAELKKLSQEADVYSFGVLLLEVLTGKSPTQELELPKWVGSIVKKEWNNSDVFDVELLRYKNIEEELVSMLNVALACVAVQLENRPTMLEVVKMIDNVKVEVEQSPLRSED